MAQDETGRKINFPHSIGEKLYREYKSGKVCSLAELLQYAQGFIGKEVYRVKDLREERPIGWCAKYNNPLVRKYKVTDVGGVNMCGAGKRCGGNSWRQCPCITFKVMFWSEENNDWGCCYIPLESWELFDSMDDVGRFLRKCPNFTDEFFNMEAQDLNEEFGRLYQKFDAIVKWFCGNADIVGKHGSGAYIDALEKIHGKAKEVSEKRENDLNEQKKGGAK